MAQWRSDNLQWRSDDPVAGFIYLLTDRAHEVDEFDDDEEEEEDDDDGPPFGIGGFGGGFGGGGFGMGGGFAGTGHHAGHHAAVHHLVGQASLALFLSLIFEPHLTQSHPF